MPYKQENQKKLISFIIPAYNVPVDMLRACIESIGELSLRPFEREIIVVDDGSDKSPLAALGMLADDIIYIRQKNQGVAVARNMGLKMAESELVQFIDADVPDPAVVPSPVALAQPVLDGIADGAP